MVQAPNPKSSSATLLYDGDCAFCLASVRWLQRRGEGNGLAYLPYQSQPSSMALAGLTAEDCARSAYVIEHRCLGHDRVYHGAGAINYALRRSRGRWSLVWRIIGGLYLVPGIRQIENLGYQWVAHNRFRLNRTGESCSSGRSADD